MIIVNENAIKLFNFSFDTKVPINDIIVNTNWDTTPSRNEEMAIAVHITIPMAPPIRAYVES